MKKEVLEEVSKRDLKIFGMIWGFIFLVIAYNSENYISLKLAIATVFLASAVFCPKVYVKIKFYQVWIKFGNFMGKVNGFLISFILFYAVFVPIGLVLKLFGKDLLSKKLNSTKESYFIDRKEQPGDMKNQF